MDKISARSCRCLFLRVEGSVGGVPEPEDTGKPDQVSVENMGGRKEVSMDQAR